ncbi:MAG: T9SS type A sorting domain-containing protein, partial [Bacteroidia bacterium]|nr:T9SS type A sorting domain-containing protein [Bacteroidia bacterium]
LELSAIGLTPGNTYYISVDNHNGASGGYRGTFKLCMQDAVTYDYYEGAILLNDLNNWCSSDGAYTTIQATNDKNPGSCWNTVGGSNRWFKFVATTTQIKVQLKTGGTEGTIQNPYMAIWQSDGTTPITCVNYSSTYSDLELSYNNLTIGSTYYISVDNHNGASGGYRGTFALCINDKADYDFYEAAEELTDLNNWCSTNAIYTTILATKDKNKGSCWNTVGGSNRWFKFLANSSNATIQLKTGGAEGTLQNPYLALWQSDGTTQIDCKNYTSTYSDLTITTSSLVAGNTYYISVDNHNGASGGYRGTFSLCIDNIDQTFYSISSGTWTTVGNWSNASHTGTVSPATPNIGDVVYIKGHNITLNSNVNCAEINITPDNASTSLTVDNASLTVTGVVRFTNNNKNFDGFLTAQNNSTINISNDFLITRAGGANTFSTTVGSGCILNVGRDLTISSTSGSTIDNNFTVNGSGKVNVTRDFTISNTSGQKTVVVFNNTSALTVTRDLIFSATAANKLEMLFNNTSSLNLYRNLSKSGGYGILTFGASSNFNIVGNVYQQSIAGTTGTGGDLFSFTNITVNSTKITSPQIVLAGPISMSGTFTHTKGIIKTTTINHLLLNLSNVPTIGSSSAYIDGPLQVIVANNGASTVNFPIGKGTVYKPAVLYTSHTDVASVTYTAELMESSAKALNYTLPGTLNRVSDFRYWQIDRTSVANLSSATIRLYYGANDGVTDYTNLAVAKTVGAGTSWVDLSGTATANGSGNILSGSFNTFSKFSLANKLTGTNPLPIELLYFTAISNGNNVDLNWATASELNNNKYEIERSIDGVNFEYLRTINAYGDGNSVQKQIYNTKDEKPYNGVSYYRLKQIDKSGEFEYSSIVSVEFKNNAYVSLYPNPAINKLNIKASESYTNATIKIINTIGGEVKQTSKLSSYNGTIDISDLVSGIYFVIIENGEKVENIKISIQK